MREREEGRQAGRERGSEEGRDRDLFPQPLFSSVPKVDRDIRATRSRVASHRQEGALGSGRGSMSGGGRVQGGGQSRGGGLGGGKGNLARGISSPKPHSAGAAGNDGGRSIGGGEGAEGGRGAGEGGASEELLALQSVVNELEATHARLRDVAHDLEEVCLWARVHVCQASKRANMCA